jgi:DnaJ family protein C protein 8
MLICVLATATACHFIMADDDQDIFDSLEREASEFTKVCFRYSPLGDLANVQFQDAEIDRIRKAFSLDS